MRGPGSSTYSDEADAASEVAAVLADLDALGIEIKLGRVPDEQRHKLAQLDQDRVRSMRLHHLDIVRVLVAKAMVAEAREIRRRWTLPDQRTPSRGRRYGDLLFSARALLPPGYDWDEVTYEAYDGKVCWSHQLAFDKNGKNQEGVTYDPAEGEALLAEFKGDARGEDDAA